MGWTQRCHAEVLGGLAAWRRRRGHYDRRLLALAWQAWWVCPDAHQWQRLQRVRRDLGLPVHSMGAASSPGWDESESLQTADEAIATLQMGQRREQFTDWVHQQTRSGALCVVGNAAWQVGQTTAAQIEGHAAVVRFNQWCRVAGIRKPSATPPESATATRGRFGQVWVLSPSAPVTLAQAPIGLVWAVFSGPDPLARLPHWPLAQGLLGRGVSVLTAPLSVWRRLVRELEAPPSAGVLMLAWFKEMTGTWRGIHVAGFDPGVSGDHVLGAWHRWTQGSRHDWHGEAALLGRWRQEGLIDLDRPWINESSGP